MVSYAAKQHNKGSSSWVLLVHDGLAAIGLLLEGLVLLLLLLDNLEQLLAGTSGWHMAHKVAPQLGGDLAL